jgi:hypothetical protein
MVRSEDGAPTEHGRPTTTCPVCGQRVEKGRWPRSRFWLAFGAGALVGLPAVGFALHRWLGAPEQLVMLLVGMGGGFFAMSLMLGWRALFFSGPPH